MTLTRKPRQRRQHERSVRVLIRPSPGQPAAYVRITQDDKASHYWLEAMPSDFGRAFRFEKPGTEGDDVYDVCLEENQQADSCTCAGNTWGGYCRHLDCVRALDRAGQLPAAGGYKPGPNDFLPF